MAERSRIIEGTWTCTSCDTKGVLGRYKVCPTCGNPREQGKETKFDFGGAATTTDAKALELARAGADWYCAYCGAGNQGDLPKCKNCGAERVKVSMPAPRIAAPPAASPPASAPVAPKRRTGLWVVLGVVGSLFFGVCGFGIWAVQEHEWKGRVTAMSWERQVHRERFSPVELQAWRDEIHEAAPVMPVNGLGESAGATNVRGCARKQRSTRQVADGQERECHTRTRSVSCGTEEQCSTQDLGNGFAEEKCHDVTKYCDESYEDCEMVTKYRTEPVYGDWCSYSSFKWTRVDTANASGTDASPRWPEAAAGPLERLVRAEKYTVSFAYEAKGRKELHVLEPKTESEYLAWHPDQAAVLTVTNGRQVVAVKPAP